MGARMPPTFMVSYVHIFTGHCRSSMLNLITNLKRNCMRWNGAKVTSLKQTYVCNRRHNAPCSCYQQHIQTAGCSPVPACAVICHGNT
jgi:hypothetical protein